MTAAMDEEFKTVDLVLASGTRTMTVDAFCLTWIKFERQLRKLTANILYQATAFPRSDENAKSRLREALKDRSTLKHDHFVGGIRKLTGVTMREIMGDDYRRLRASINQAYDFRNKIFHGQQTGHNLDKDELIAIQGDVRRWCNVLSQEGTVRFGYDGFARNSLRKTNRADVTAAVDNALAANGWENFVSRL